MHIKVIPDHETGAAMVALPAPRVGHGPCQSWVNNPGNLHRQSRGRRPPVRGSDLPRTAMANAILHAVYVNPGERKSWVSRRRRLSWQWPNGLVWPYWTGCRNILEGVGGDGGELNSPSRRAHRRIYYKLVRWLISCLPEAPPTEPSDDQPVVLWPPLPAWSWPHPGLMAPGSPPPGIEGSGRSRC